MFPCLQSIYSTPSKFVLVVKCNTKSVQSISCVFTSEIDKIDNLFAANVNSFFLMRKIDVNAAFDWLMCKKHTNQKHQIM